MKILAPIKLLAHISKPLIPSVLLMYFITPVSAATFSVAPGDSDGLIQAINNSNSTTEVDTINLSPNSTYSLTQINNTSGIGSNGLPKISSEVVINGNQSTIQRNSSSVNFRFFEITSSGRLLISNLILSNGKYIDNNYGGGAIFNGGTLSLNDIKLENNISGTGGGGALSNWSGASVEINNSEFIGNSVTSDGSGGSILNRGELKIYSAQITESYANNVGGAIYINTLDPVDISKAEIFKNHSRNGGGGIFVYRGEVNIDESEINENIVDIHPNHGFGGGILNELYGNIKITKSDFKNNISKNGGSIYNNANGVLKINQSCLSGNSNAGIYNNNNYPIDARENYWGSANGPSGVWSGSGDSVGANVNFSNYLSNCPSNQINIPYLSQTSEPWGGDLFDSTDKTIGQVGCSLASAVMILQSYGLNVLPDGTPLDPGSLNQWLISNNRHGYKGGVNFYDISKLSKEIIKHLENQGDTFDFNALQYHRIDNLDYSIIDQTIAELQRPLIFEEINLNSPSGVHFTVAKGVVTSGSDYLISDPLVETREHFLQPPSQLTSVRYFRPSNTNLSGLLLQADQDLDITLTSPSNETADADSNNIPESSFKLQAPLTNSLDPNITAGPPVWELDYPTPLVGDYTISFSATNPGWYEFWLFAYNIEGESQLHKQKIYLGAGQTASYTLNYTQTGYNFSTLTKQVGFDKFIEDIKTARENGWITNTGTANSLTQLTLTAQRFFPAIPKITHHQLSLIEQKLNNFNGKLVTPEGHQFLSRELHWLQTGL